MFKKVNNENKVVFTKRKSYKLSASRGQHLLPVDK